MNRSHFSKRAAPTVDTGRAALSGVVSEDLRRHNRGLVLQRLFRERYLSRTALAELTGLTRAGISRISSELVHAGMLREREQGSEHGGRGRPQVDLELAPDGAYVIGVGIGAYEQWMRIANQRGDCVARRPLHLLGEPSASTALAKLAREARALIATSKIPSRRIVGMVIAVAGVVDENEGVVLDSPNIGWQGVRVTDELGTHLHFPIYVEALHHVLNLAESCLDLRPAANNAVLVNIALGIGASVMEEGRIVRGTHTAAGQIGHMRVDGATELCTCGRHGCLDTVASGYAVLRRLDVVPQRRRPREHHPADARRLIVAIEREHRGEPKAREAFHFCGERLGDALDAVRALLDPQRILLAGPLAQTASFVEGVRVRQVAQRRVNVADEAELLSIAAHSSDAAAALLALKLFAFGPALELAQFKR